MLKVLFALGGTGGHIFPALALAEALPDAEFHFVSLRSELRRGLIQSLPVDVRLISGDKLKLRHLLENLKGLSEARRLIRELDPHLVIATGSYACLMPALAAVLEGKRLYLIEQNSLPGKAIRFLTPLARRTFLAFENSIKYFPRPLRRKLVIAGNPVRGAFWSLRESYDPRTGVLVFLSGSQGARAVNQLALRLLRMAKQGEAEPVKELILVTGSRYYSEVMEQLGELGELIPVEVFPFSREPWRLLERAALVVSRAGASTVWELGVSGRPSVLLPYPMAEDDHQRVNAELLAEIGGALTLSEDSPEVLNLILKLLREPRKLEEMREALLRSFSVDARRLIWKEILNDLNFRRG